MVFKSLNSIYEDFSLDHAQRIKEIEKKTNHDVKAVEYFIKEKLGDKKSLESHLEFVHFACTSEDINNLAYGLMLKEGRDLVMLPVMQEIIQQLANLAKEYSNQP